MLNLLAQYDASSGGVDVTDVMSLPEPFAQVFSHLLRQRKMDVVMLAREFRLTAVETEKLCAALVQKGFLRETPAKQGAVFYRLRIASRSQSYMSDNLWRKLSD
ncbi:MAG: hypothetical protein H6658_01290 [Ardenticatenaceae bacterium]|nr:hypothetical protein [Ardenticatenaceae bacterium]